MSYQKPDDEIGALWEREGAKGTYMTGEINGERIVCFRNKSQSPKAPTWKVLKSKPKDEPRQSQVDDVQAPTDDDIPF